MKNIKQEYFPAVDFMRGLGAFVILVWHYHHFYFTKPYFSPETGNPIWEFDVQPFYGLLWPFYHYGAWAVQFFWVLSGFVFAHVYSRKTTGAKSFFIFRLSRLYPLHIITLLVIAVLQYASLYLTGKFQVLAINDAYHFLLHLFFASNWGLEKGYSFNSPVWSISVEEIAYWGFWIVAARNGKFSAGKSLLLTAIAFVSMPKTGIIGQCFFYFMAGSTAYMLFCLASTLRFKIYLTAAVASCAFALFCLKSSYSYFNEIPLIASRIAKFDGILMHMGMSSAFCFAVLFAATIDASKLFIKAESFFVYFGSLTYSTYLWHLPIQIGIIIIFDLFSIDRSFFNNSSVLILFLVLMTVVGRLSFIYIERPLQVEIRKRFV